MVTVLTRDNFLIGFGFRNIVTKFCVVQRNRIFLWTHKSSSHPYFVLQTSPSAMQTVDHNQIEVSIIDWKRLVYALDLHGHVPI